MTKGNNILHHTIGWFQLAAVVLLSLTTGSCATTDETSVLEDEQPVIVSAYVSESALTRATKYDDKDHGPVTTGTYYLTFPISAGMKTAEVVFKDGYGEAIVMPEEKKLTWKNIGNGTTDRSLGLSNVSPKKHKDFNNSTYYYNPIVFKDDEKQFVAGRYIPYGEENTNDILLASKSPYRDTPPQDHTSNYVHFELHHCMARVRVIVETRHNDESFEKLEDLLEKAKVDITNVVHKPYSFVPYIGDKTTFTDVVAISEDGTLNGCEFDKINLLNTLDDGVDNEWAETGDALDDNKNVVGNAYTTYDILLPPQQLRTDNDRPRLVITVPDESKTNGVKTYSGILPHIMYDEEENPLSLEFLAEHLLTIRTVISNDPPELIFMPVKVVEWVDKGEFDLNAKQAGIYSEEDFKDMMGYYENYNASKLLQYGYRKDNKWVFNIFHNLKFSNEEIEGKMPVEEDDRDYSFDFNTWFTVKVDGEEYTAKKLKALLSGEEQEEDDTQTDTNS